jgi:excisionase family DNA binding protein
MGGYSKDSDGNAQQRTRRAIEPLWNVADTARYLGLTNKGVYGLAERRVLPSIKVGGRLRFDPDDVAEWVRQHRRAR